MNDETYINISDRIREQARSTSGHLALAQGDENLTYSQLNEKMDKVGAALQAAGVKPKDTIAVCGYNSIPYAVLYLSALRIGAVPALIAPSTTPEGIAGMVEDSGATLFFVDESLRDVVMPCLKDNIAFLPLDDAEFDTWAESTSAAPIAVDVRADWPLNIIYSSGTTGKPKGIVHSHSLRSGQIEGAGVGFGYGVESVTMITTPLYSNTTLVSFIPSIALGGSVILMKKFNADEFLQQSEKYRVTHTMLVPVQYKRIMETPDFDSYDLDCFVAKFCTSAPFAADLKRDIIDRWPGGLIEFYGMTEGGGTCILIANQFPDKLHTVGLPAPGHDIRLIGEDGKEVAKGEIGEIVGHSGTMMKGYHGMKDKTAETEWYCEDGKRFIRTGDNGQFDEDGFMILRDRKKDMIISGGFNIFPSDLEAELIKHDMVKDVAVVGVPSEDWGETPVAFIVPADAYGSAADGGAVKEWLATKVGKTQRLHDVVFIEELPRSAIGKILKRDLRDTYKAA